MACGSAVEEQGPCLTNTYVRQLGEAGKVYSENQTTVDRKARVIAVAWSEELPGFVQTTVSSATPFPALVCHETAMLAAGSFSSASK